jgi:UDP-glucose 4-epimerase
MGVHLVDRLLESERTVRIYDRSPNTFRAVPQGVAENIEGQLRDYELIRDAVEGVEVVYHLASTTVPSTSNDDLIYDVGSNLIDTIHLLKSCVEFGVRKVVFASSVAVYGLPKALPIAEDHPTHPISSYGIAKLAIEKYLELFRRLYGLDYLALRISNPYGPYQNPMGHQGVVGMFLHRVYNEEPLTVWGDGSALRDYLYITDLVDALERAAEVESQERVLNVGSGRATSLKELLQLIARTVGVQPAVDYFPARAVDIPVSVLDISRARAELGWSPKTEIPEGVATTWTWIRTLAENKLMR